MKKLRVWSSCEKKKGGKKSINCYLSQAGSLEVVSALKVEKKKINAFRSCLLNPLFPFPFAITQSNFAWILQWKATCVWHGRKRNLIILRYSAQYSGKSRRIWYLHHFKSTNTSILFHIYENDAWFWYVSSNQKKTSCKQRTNQGSWVCK